jgi:hypothetical protein
MIEQSHFDTKHTKDTKDTKLENSAAQAVLKKLDIEIHQKTKMFPRELQVSQKLRLVEPRQAFGCLDLDDYLILKQQIDAISPSKATPS